MGNTPELEKLELNWEARNTRHKRVFLRSVLFSKLFFRLMLDIKGFFTGITTKFFSKFFKIRPFHKVYLVSPVLVKDPFSKLIRQTVIISMALLVVTSIAPKSILETGFTAEFNNNDADYIVEEDELVLPPFLMNEEGFILKDSPATEGSDRIGMNDLVQHTVVQGDTLSSIAALYGISLQTLLWENNLSEYSTLRIGQVLTVPPVDGVSHLIASAGETLSSIAKSYGVEADLIKQHNNIEGDAVFKGQKLFIPGGKRKVPIRVEGTRSSRIATNTFESKLVMGSNAAPTEGKRLIYPTIGHISQGFRAGHYAYDIANTSKPDIWAAASGMVTKASGGCLPREVKVDRACGSGYGNYVIIDHGNGLQTLYAHLETIYVTEGQSVGMGQAIGKMGSSGRTYGATGIHLHFEVYDNGVKKNPGKYF